MMNTENYASVWRRAGSFALDYIPILVYLLILTLSFYLLNTVVNISQLLFADRIQAQGTAFLFVTLPVMLYFALGESSVRQATWGKQRLGLRVTNIDGKQIGFWRALVRSVLKFIPWELSHTLIWQIRFTPEMEPSAINYGFVLVYALIGLNLLFLLMTKTHQTLYDLLVKAYVVKSAS